MRSRWPPVQPCTTVISFCVSVPVLSEQITVAQPSVSTAGSLRMSAWCLIMRCMPRARQIVTTAGSPSGTAAIARLTAVMNRLTMSLLLGLQVGQEAVLERVRQVRVAEQAVDEHDGADGQAGRAEHLAQLGQLALQRRFLVLERLEHLGDQADLRVHAGGGDQPACRARR